MTELRPYQEDAVRSLRAAFRKNRRVLYQLPTGGGKTIVFSWLAKAVASRGKSVTILAHRRELVRQASAKLTDAGVDHGIIDADTRLVTRHPIQVASVMTLVRRLEFYQPPSMVVVDEAHHAVAGTWDKILKAYDQSLILGVTATPERLDGKGLDTHFDDLVLGPPVRDLIIDEYLANYTAYRRPQGAPDLTGISTTAGDYDQRQLSALMSNAKLLGDAVEHYRRFADGVPAIAFCVTIAHSEAVAAQFQAAGYRAYSVDGSMSPAERDARIGGLADGSTQVLTSCMLVSEGLDIPGVVAAILLRPTQSLALYLQQVGRAFRPKPGGANAIILDHAGNLDAHGMPCDPREWSLHGRKKKPKGESPVQTCFSCYATVAAHLLVCPHCHAVLRDPPEPKPLPDYVDGNLVKATSKWFDERGKRRFARDRDGIAAAVRECTDYRDLKELAKAMNFKLGWAIHAARGLGWTEINSRSTGFPVNFIPTRKQP